MTFMTDFRRGFRLARGGEWWWADFDEDAPPPRQAPPSLAASEAECRRLAGVIADRDREIDEARQLLSDITTENDLLSSEVAKLEADVKRLRGQLAAAQKPRASKEGDANASALEFQIAEQAAELRRLRAEVAKLKEEAAEPAGDVKKVADRVWRVVAKSVHPDMSPKGETATAALERVFKTVRAEVDRIKKG